MVIVSYGLLLRDVEKLAKVRVGHARPRRSPEDQEQRHQNGPGGAADRGQVAAGADRHAAREPPRRIVEHLSRGLPGPARQLGSLPRQVRRADRAAERSRPAAGLVAPDAAVHPAANQGGSAGRTARRGPRSSARPSYLPTSGSAIEAARLAAMANLAGAGESESGGPKTGGSRCWPRSPGCGSSLAIRSWSMPSGPAARPSSSCSWRSSRSCAKGTTGRWCSASSCST